MDRFSQSAALYYRHFRPDNMETVCFGERRENNVVFVVSERISVGIIIAINETNVMEYGGDVSLFN